MLRTRPACRLLLAALVSSGPVPPILAQQVEAPPLVDQPLAAARRELLQFAFDAVSRMPTNPHAKNRSHVQESVVAACIQLGQCKLAHELASRIDDWRRGVCLADLAVYLIEHGEPAASAPLLDEARKVAETPEPDPQAWRRDRIRARVAAAHLLLGTEQKVKDWSAGIVESELGVLDATRMRRVEAKEVDKLLEQFDGVLASGSFEAVRSTLGACAVLFDRFYTDEAVRTKMEKRVLTGYEKLPIPLRLELVVQLVETALRRDDKPTAQRLLVQAQHLLARTLRLPEEEIAWRGRIAGLRARAGETEAARAEAAAALARFVECKDRIVDIYRAGALRPVAVAFQLAGDPKEARAAWRRAVEEGVHNPNSRPRADDLAATCVLMAVAGFDVDAELRARLEQIEKGLGHPW
jgi:hypothetical protein